MRVCGSSAATRERQASASSAPAPRQTPSIAATVGQGSAASRAQRRLRPLDPLVHPGPVREPDRPPRRPRRRRRSRGLPLRTTTPARPGSASSSSQRGVEVVERAAVEDVHRARGIVHDQVDDLAGPGGPRPPAGMALDAEAAHPSRSSTKATPCPPPTHSAARPRRAPRRRISSSSVSSSRAPLAPTGWPSAMAPPLTLSRSSGISPSAPVAAQLGAGERAPSRRRRGRPAPAPRRPR